MSRLHSSRQYWVWRAFDDRLALRLPRRGLFCLAGLVLLLATIFTISILTGSYGVPWGDVVATLIGSTVTTAIDNVVWEFRLPRMLTAAMVGAMMALSGAALQNVTRNGLADPSLVGVSQGAALAVVSLVVAFPNVAASLRPAAAFAGGMAAAILVQFLSISGQRQGSSIRFVLLGIGVAAFISSITTALLTYGDIQRASAALTWMAGSINAASWSDVWLLLVALLVLMPILLGISRQIAALQMGEDVAIALGAPVRFARYALITLAVAMAAIATAVVGPLGFVGLIAPHAARRLAHAGIGLTLVITALTGAVLVSGADLLGRALFAPIQIPAGIVTAVIGVPIFVYLLWRQAAQTRQ